MKKIFSLLVAVMMVFFLAACDNTNVNDCVDDDCAPEVIDVMDGNDEVDENEVESDGKFAAGDKGEGPFTVTTPIATFTIPEGVEYEVKALYVAEDGKYATVEFGLNPAGKYQFASIRITNQGMVDSYEKATEHTIALQNLDTYKEGKSELLDEVKYNEIKYQTIKTSHEYGTNYFLAGYEGGREITLNIPEKDGGLTIDDGKTKELMESLSIVPLN